MEELARHTESVMNFGLIENETMLRMEQKSVWTKISSPVGSVGELRTKETVVIYRETLQHLYNLLTVACRERDEARNELHKSLAELSELRNLVNSFLLPGTEFQISKTTPTNYINSENYFFDHNPSQFSALDCISLAGASQDMSSLTMAEPGTYDSIQTSIVQDRIDHTSILFENLARGRVLPKKGQLLQAVLEAGPLLESLLFTRTVPKWRNPPSLPVSQRMDSQIMPFLL